MRVYVARGPASKDVSQYAMQAVFETLVKGVAHRDYSVHGSGIRLHMFSDRPEIFSPGVFPGTMTIESLPFRQTSRSERLVTLLARCPVPAELLSGERNFMMDRQGEGASNIFPESKRLSGRWPEYRLIDDAGFMLTLFAAKPLQDGAES